MKKHFLSAVMVSMSLLMFSFTEGGEGNSTSNIKVKKVSTEAKKESRVARRCSASGSGSTASQAKFRAENAFWRQCDYISSNSIRFSYSNPRRGVWYCTATSK